jgi:hypothetical protein
MARVSGALQNQGGPFRRLLVGIVYFLTRRRLDRVIMPVQVTGHHPQIFKLKGLAELRVATLVGCPL